MPGQKSERESSSLSHAASAAGHLQAALKTGKQIAGISKGAAAGPYGMLATGLWENRKLLAKVLAAASFLLLLPILFLLMLPPLIFSGQGLDQADSAVWNDNQIILKNISEMETAVEEILWKRHDEILAQIEKEIQSLDPDCEYSIQDDYAGGILFESTLVISQFCASRQDYREIRLDGLKKLLEQNTGGIFFYTLEVTEQEVYDAETDSTRTVEHYAYTVQYAGDTYFADTVFRLTEEQAVLAEEYASNLQLFLMDTDYRVSVDTNPDLIPGETGNAAVNLALTKLGIPYSQALRNQEGYFDCSSFTYWVYSQLGIRLQHGGSNTAAAQGQYITENHLAVSYEDLAPGDLIFYSFETNGRYMNISHIAIYAGNGYVVDASSSRGKVVYRPIYGQSSIVLCGRPYTAT